MSHIILGEEFIIAQMQNWIDGLKNTESDILPAPLSDHKTISLRISDCDNSPKPSYWKLNSSAVKYNDVINTITSLIKNKYWNRATEQNVYAIIWELFQFELAKYLQNFSSHQKESRKLF